MAASVQLNTRIDPELKRRGDAVFVRAGLTSSEVVRAVWSYAAEHQQVPECILPATDANRIHKLALAEQGAGKALRMAGELGIDVSVAPSDHDELRSLMYDDLTAAYAQQHGGGES